MILIKTIKIPNYPAELEISKTRRKVYYVEGEDEIPPRLLKELGKSLIWVCDSKDGNFYLTDAGTQDRIIKNKNHNKPRTKRISGQDLYSQSIIHQTRNKIVGMLHTFFDKYVQYYKIDEPLKNCVHIRYDFGTPRTELEDLDNYHTVFTKCFMDTLKQYRQKGIYKGKMFTGKFETVHLPDRPLPDDNVDWVPKTTQCWFPFPTRVLIVRLSMYEPGEREKEIEKLVQLASTNFISLE